MSVGEGKAVLDSRNMYKSKVETVSVCVCVISKFMPAFDFATPDIEGFCAMRIAKLVKEECQAKGLSPYSLGAKNKTKQNTGRS